MHLKGVISKKQQMFGPYFRNPHKTTDFFDTHKVIFWEKKIRTLLSGFGPIFFSHKNRSRAETTQNNEKRLFYFSLRFPTRIHFWVSKMQIPKSFHPTVQYTSWSVLSTQYCKQCIPYTLYSLFVVLLLGSIEKVWILLYCIYQIYAVNFKQIRVCCRLL